MDSKAEKGILIGYEGDDGYRIFLQPGNTTCRSRDVIFDEKVITSTTVLDWPMNTSADARADEDVLEEQDAVSKSAQEDAAKKSRSMKATRFHRPALLCCVFICTSISTGIHRPI